MLLAKLKVQSFRQLLQRYTGLYLSKRNKVQKGLFVACPVVARQRLAPRRRELHHPAELTSWLLAYAIVIDCPVLQII